ncbi:MAG: circadian clock KaiB family protein [Microcystaceae cyanobacterium]
MLTLLPPSTVTTLPSLYKGIALFTPGGDLIYCIDPNKQDRWHSHLCRILQQVLKLPEIPLFLIPSYTATIDRWLDPISGEVRTVAECYPAVRRFQPLLNAVFQTDNLRWKTVVWKEENCHPMVLNAYRPLFPQLWETHDLIIPVDRLEISPSIPFSESFTPFTNLSSPAQQSYVLRLFVSSQNANTKRTLTLIHQLLEQELKAPYTLKVIDIAKHPDLAESHHISATPTLMRVWPQPIKRIVGELKDITKLGQIISHI